MRRLYYLTLTLVVSLLFVSVSKAQPGDIKTIKLKQKASYQPKYMHIVSVKDDRDDTTGIGYLLTGLMQKETKVTLQNGLSASVSQFIFNNFEQDLSTPEFEMHINSLEVTDKPIGLKKQVDMRLRISFYQRGNKITEFTGSNYIQYMDDAGSRAEQLIRQGIEHCIKEIDNWAWINSSALSAKPQINVIVTIAENSDDPDVIVYSKNRPLSFDDFRANPDDLSIAAAATYSGTGMSYTSEKLNSTITLKITITPTFSKDKSWYKKDHSSTGVLKHEQTHFDITAIKTCELVNTIKSYAFSMDNYAKELQNMLKENEKQTTGMQQQYDKETNHGTITLKQQEWEKSIAEKLAAQNCF